jgi:hypothetical protein
MAEFARSTGQWRETLQASRAMETALRKLAYAPIFRQAADERRHIFRSVIESQGLGLRATRIAEAQKSLRSLTSDPAWNAALRTATQAVSAGPSLAEDVALAVDSGSTPETFLKRARSLPRGKKLELASAVLTAAQGLVEPFNAATGGRHVADDDVCRATRCSRAVRDRDGSCGAFRRVISAALRPSPSC